MPHCSKQVYLCFRETVWAWVRDLLVAWVILLSSSVLIGIRDTLTQSKYTSIFVAGVFDFYSGDIRRTEEN